MLTLIPITLRKANDFVSTFHRHSGRTSRDGGKFAVAAEHECELVGIAIVGQPIARLLNDGYTAEVLRTCVVPDAPKGVNSFLYAACWRAWRAMGGRKLVTYTLATESGASLRGAGWKIVAEIKGSKGWARPNQERHRKYQEIYGQAKLRWECSDQQQARCGVVAPLDSISGDEL